MKWRKEILHFIGVCFELTIDETGLCLRVFKTKKRNPEHFRCGKIIWVWGKVKPCQKWAGPGYIYSLKYCSVVAFLRM